MKAFWEGVGFVLVGAALLVVIIGLGIEIGPMR